MSTAAAPAEASPAASAERGEDCAGVDCCAEKLKRDLKIKNSNNAVVRRQQSKSKDATATASSSQNGTVSLENGDHKQDEDEEAEKRSASQCNGGDGGDSDKNRATSLLGNPPDKSDEEKTSSEVEARLNGGGVIEVDEANGVGYEVYESELQMPDIMRLIQKDLSEPYSVYTYRYFIHNWPHLCLMARVSGECVGAIVCKLDYHRKVCKRGYIAMLAVDERHRKRKIGSTLVRRAIHAMQTQDADEVVLETEITNRPALRLYENLGFVRDKRLFRYYLNGVDALRLKLWLR